MSDKDRPCTLCAGNRKIVNEDVAMAFANGMRPGEALATWGTPCPNCNKENAYDR
jgi:hypothetical protein